MSTFFSNLRAILVLALLAASITGLTACDDDDGSNEMMVRPPPGPGDPPDPASPPDLDVRRFSVSDDRPQPGERITLSAEVYNYGGRSESTTTLRYYRSDNRIILSGDLQVGTDRVGALDPGESSDESERIDVPETPGTYYYGACVDEVPNEDPSGDDCSSGEEVVVASNNDGTYRLQFVDGCDEGLNAHVRFFAYSSSGDIVAYHPRSGHYVTNFNRTPVDTGEHTCQLGDGSEIYEICYGVETEDGQKIAGVGYNGRRYPYPGSCARCFSGQLNVRTFRPRC